MDAPFSLDLDISRSDASCQDIRASRLGTAFDSLTAASVALASEKKKKKKRLVRIARLKRKKKERTTHDTHEVELQFETSRSTSHDARTSRYEDH